MTKNNNGQMVFWIVFAVAVVGLVTVAMSYPIGRPVGEARVLPNIPGYDPLCVRYEYLCVNTITDPGDGNGFITPPDSKNCRLVCVERGSGSGVGIFSRQPKYYPLSSGGNESGSGVSGIRQLPKPKSYDECLKNCDLRGGHMEDCERECKGGDGGSGNGGDNCPSCPAGQTPGCVAKNKGGSDCFIVEGRVHCPDNVLNSDD